MCESDIRFVVRPLALCGFIEDQMILRQRANSSEEHVALIVDTEREEKAWLSVAKGADVKRCMHHTHLSKRSLSRY